ncbi:MAG TPA: hypothetical protein PKK51_10990, partial [Rhodocyclaceae bacterium]|nr:hypothetical protein [Rhodocyclaceae bacterium]
PCGRGTKWRKYWPWYWFFLAYSDKHGHSSIYRDRAPNAHGSIEGTAVTAGGIDFFELLEAQPVGLSMIIRNRRPWVKSVSQMDRLRWCLHGQGTI